MACTRHAPVLPCRRHCWQTHLGPKAGSARTGEGGGRPPHEYMKRNPGRQLKAAQSAEIGRCTWNS
eukprot:2831556-Pyramimonas_sp.AAC.1